MGPAGPACMSGSDFSSVWQVGKLRLGRQSHAPKITQLTKDWPWGLCQSCGTEGSAEEGAGRKMKGGEGTTDRQMDRETQ